MKGKPKSKKEFVKVKFSDVDFYIDSFIYNTKDTLVLKLRNLLFAKEIYVDNWDMLD